jgi:hypothetical protein
MTRRAFLIAAAGAVSADATTSGEQPPCLDGRRIFRLWRDASTSMSEDELRKIIPALLNAVKSLTDVLTGVEVVHFSAGRSRTAAQLPTQFCWGLPPAVGSSVSRAYSELTLPQKILKTSRNHAITEALEEQQAAAAKEASARAARIDAELKRLGEFLSKVPTRVAPCTQFTALADRIAKEDLPRNLVLTDAWMDCRADEREDYTPKAMSGDVLIVLFAGGDSGWETNVFDRRTVQLRALFPTAHVEPPYMLERALRRMIMIVRKPTYSPVSFRFPTA